MKFNPTLNHSAAHILACAILQLYPNTKLGIGPSTSEGFYYDFEFENPISEMDLPKIEKQMKKIISGNYQFLLHNDGVLENQPYKDEIISELKTKGENITYYSLTNPLNNQVVFLDVCAGPHVTSTNQIKHFKLLSIAGAYWRGDSKNKQLVRIYGTAWETEEELTEFLAILADRKERDHRKIGKDMEIFAFDQMAGQGFPMWLVPGMTIKNEIQNFIRNIEKQYGFVEVSTPILGSVELYKTSGHWEHYKEDMFPIMKLDNEELVLRPMTCPHHILLYNMTRRSYRDLPMRLCEQARLYRYEKSGALTGLERVRSMELTEGHIFARPDQVFEEFRNAYKLISEALDKFNIKIDYVSLSLRDKNNKEKFINDDAMWDKAEEDLRNVLKSLGIEYEEKIGEAAFYGPKIDIQVKTVLGHEITISTLQLDFLLPKRFECYYIDQFEQKQTPVLIHRGLIGTYERFISILLEQTKGDLPFWLSPKQIEILPVSDENNEYANEIFTLLKRANYRVTLDDRPVRLSKKIRDAWLTKAKYQIIIGQQEVENKTLAVRLFGSEETRNLTFEQLIKELEILK